MRHRQRIHVQGSILIFESLRPFALDVRQLGVGVVLFGMWLAGNLLLQPFEHFFGIAVGDGIAAEQLLGTRGGSLTLARQQLQLIG